MAEDIGFEPDFSDDFEKPKKSKKKAERSAPAVIQTKIEVKEKVVEPVGTGSEENQEPKELSKQQLRKRRIKAAKERARRIAAGEEVEPKPDTNQKPQVSEETGELSRSAQKKLKRKLGKERKEAEGNDEPKEPKEPEAKKPAPAPKNEKKENEAPKFKHLSKDKNLSFEAIERKFSTLLSTLVDNTSRFKQGQEIVKKEIEAGKITEEEADTLYRVYNRNLRVKKHRERLIQLIGEQAPIEAVRDKVDLWVRAGKMTRFDAGILIKRWRQKEVRRFERQNTKIQASFCFHCRESGHKVADCPSRQASESEAGVCFKCGSGEHSIQSCKKKNVKGFPFATCFVCKDVGHISRDCHQNQNGVYPEGGSCNVCGSTSHLKRNCPEMAAQKVGFNPERKHYSARAFTNSAVDSADADYDPTEVKVDIKPMKKQAKHIKF